MFGNSALKRELEWARQDVKILKERVSKLESEVFSLRLKVHIHPKGDPNKPVLHADDGIPLRDVVRLLLEDSGVDFAKEPERLVLVPTKRGKKS